MLLHRDFQSWTGGHAKFLDYIAHINAHSGWRVLLYLTPRSRGVAGNPFPDAAELCDEWRPEDADALLLGGTDWLALDGHALRPRQPIINLVQGVRHAEAGSALRGFLGRRAVRVCVSNAVADAIAATGEVNGPVRVISAAVDVAALAKQGSTVAGNGVFVDAVKQVALGQALVSSLGASGLTVDLLQQRVPRDEYLQRMAAAAIVVALPASAEGFYLPGMEAMAMGRVLVQPDCIGSRDYLVDGVNALVPERHHDAIVAQVLRAHRDPPLQRRLAAAAAVSAQRFDLATERGRVHALLDELEETWRC